MLEKSIKQLEERITERTPLFWLLLLFLVVYDSVVSYLVMLFDPTTFEIEFLNDISLFGVFIVSIVLGPLVETFVFQFGVILLLKKVNLPNKIIIAISSLLFSISHNYNFIYILAVIIPGLIYAWYFIELEKRNRMLAFFFVFLLHASSNFYAFLVDDLLGWF